MVSDFRKEIVKAVKEDWKKDRAKWVHYNKILNRDISNKKLIPLGIPNHPYWNNRGECCGPITVKYYEVDKDYEGSFDNTRDIEKANAKEFNFSDYYYKCKAKALGWD